MLSVPALLSVGMPPVAALATNKMQSVIGTTMAVITYWRRGYVELKSLLPSLLLAFAGGSTGALVVSRIDTSLLNIAVPIALIGIALYFLFSPKLSDADRTSRLSFNKFVPVMAFIVGFYDGVFGPGTGSFFSIGFVLLFGLGMTRATGNTKALNLMSNAAALVVFIPMGQVVWPVALVMAVGQIAGGYIGARTGIRYGAKVIRPLIVVVSIAMAIKLLVWP